MGQQEVINFLRKHKKGWLTARQIAEKLKASYGSVTTNLKKLRQSKQVKFKISTKDPKSQRKRKVFVYRY